LVSRLVFLVASDRINPVKRNDRTTEDQRNPYERLFVYQLDGDPDPSPWLDEPAFLGCWKEDGYGFLFFSENAHGIVRSGLDAQQGVRLADQYEMSYEEWQGGLELAPIRVGRLIVTPFWMTPPEDAGPDSLIVRIDPGVVFGAGQHPTTRDCLYALNQVLETGPIKSCLDLGTGTGILALAAAALGVEEALAVDNNPLCVRTALSNIDRNGMGEIVRAVEGDALSFLGTRVDLIISNIHMAVAEQMVKSDQFYSCRWIILSGLMRSQAREIERILAGKPVKVLKKWESEGIWTTFLIKTLTG